MKRAGRGDDAGEEEAQDRRAVVQCPCTYAEKTLAVTAAAAEVAMVIGNETSAGLS